MMIQAGLYSRGSDPEIDAAIAAWPKLDAFIAASARGGIEGSFAELTRCIAPEPEAGSRAAADRQDDTG